MRISPPASDPRQSLERKPDPSLPKRVRLEPVGPGEAQLVESARLKGARAKQAPTDVTPFHPLRDKQPSGEVTGSGGPRAPAPNTPRSPERAVGEPSEAVTPARGESPRDTHARPSEATPSGPRDTGGTTHWLFVAITSFVATSVKEGIRQAAGAVGNALVGAAGAVGRFCVNAVVLSVGKLTSAVQTTFGLESVGRDVNAGERAWLREVFREGLDVDALTLKFGFAGVASLSDRPFALGNTIYLKDHAAPPGDASAEQINQYRALLVHEAVHAWQYQNGNVPIAESLWYDRVVGNAYDWRESVAAGKAFDQLNVEQQGQLLQDAVRAGYFETGQFLVAGHDHSQAVEAALLQLRRPR